VVELWDNPDNLSEWQEGFISFEHLTGQAGKEGATARILFKMQGDKVMELIETISSNNLPEEFTGWYESKYTKNKMSNHFTSINSSTTRWDSEIHYTEMRGFMMKLFSKLRPSMFQKQTQKWMDNFKGFAESVV